MLKNLKSRLSSNDSLELSFKGGVREMSQRHTGSDKQKFSALLKAYRHEHNMTQEELGRMLDTSVFSVNRWETAKHYPNHSVLKLMKILKILT